MFLRKLSLGSISVLLVALTCAQARLAWSDDYPSKRVTFVVALSAGGYADAVGRVIAEHLATYFNQPFIVENRGGAGGNIAAKSVIGDAADGYTVLVTTTQLAINETLYKNKGFSTSDLKPVSIPVSAPEVILANPNNPAHNVADLVKASKDTPLSYGSPGLGTGSFIEAEYLFRVVAKIKTLHIPYSGGGPAISDLLGDHIHVLAATVPPAISLINAGKLRGLGIATAKRMPFVPSVPTFAEGGFPNYYAASWVGLFVAAKTPDAIVEKLNAAINEILKEPDVLHRLEPFGVEMINGSPAQTAAFFQGETKHWGDMVKTLGISVD
jgi:tripartite-type tricarboxylate transporter receptor subunit TctC